MSYSSITYLLISVVCAAGGQLLFKIGSQDAQSLQSFINMKIALGLGAYAVGTILWIYVLSRAPLTIVYPFTALTFSLVYLGAVFIIGEPISVRGCVGVALILIGIYFVSSSSSVSR